MSKPRIILRKESRKVSGEIPLYLYFHRQGKAYRVALGIDVVEEKWDAAKERIRGRGKQIERENLLLGQGVARANAILVEYELRNERLSPTRFKELFQAKGASDDFLEFYEGEMKSQYNRRLIGDATLEIEERTLAKMKAYRANWAFYEIDRKLIEGFDEWHQKRLTKAGHSGEGEREKALKKIRKYLNEARDSAGKEFTNPFQGFKWPRYRAKEDHLSEEELREVLDLWRDTDRLKILMERQADDRNLKPGTRAGYLSAQNIDQTRKYMRAFLLQCFTAARESDIKAWRWGEHVRENEIVFTPHKTKDTSGKVVHMPITPIIAELLGESSSSPVVKLPSNQKYNAAIKRIAALAGIERNISSKMSRHTFGSLMVSRGVSLVSLMGLMGVTKIETVLIYAHSSQKQRRKEITNAQEGFI